MVVLLCSDNERVACLELESWSFTSASALAALLSKASELTVSGSNSIICHLRICPHFELPSTTLATKWEPTKLAFFSSLLWLTPDESVKLSAT